MKNEIKAIYKKLILRELDKIEQLILIKSAENEYDKIARILTDLLLKNWGKKAKEAIAEAIRILKNGQGKITPDEINVILERISGILSVDFQALVNGEVNKQIVSSYTKAQVEVLTDVRPSFNVTDEKAINWLKRDSSYWIGKYYDNQLSDRIRETVSEVLIKGMSRDKAAEFLKDRFRNHFSRSKPYWEGFANHVTTRAREFGHVEAYQKAGIKYLRVEAVLDRRTSRICRAMHGRIIPVAAAVKQRDKLLNAKSPEEVKKIAPWERPEVVETTLTKKLIRRGVVLPPYHWNCRTITVMAKDGEYDIEEVASKAANDILKESGNNFEIAKIIRNGRIEYTKKGGNDYVDFGNIDDKINSRGVELFVHNHPSSGCFSPQDLIFCIRQNIREIRAVAPKSIFGEVQFYFRKVSDKWNVDLKSFRQEISRTDLEVYNEFTQKIDNGEMNIETAEKLHSYEVLKRLSQKFDFFEFGYIVGIRKSSYIFKRIWNMMKQKSKIVKILTFDDYNQFKQKLIELKKRRLLASWLDNNSIILDDIEVSDKVKLYDEDKKLKIYLTETDDELMQREFDPKLLKLDFDELMDYIENNKKNTI